jgi:hypothetical protein
MPNRDHRELTWLEHTHNVAVTAATRMLFKCMTATWDAAPSIAAGSAAATVADPSHWHQHCCHLYRCSWNALLQNRYQLGCYDLANALLTGSLPTGLLLPCEISSTSAQAKMAFGAALGALAFADAGLATSVADFLASSCPTPRRLANMLKPSIPPACSAAMRASSSALVT